MNVAILKGGRLRFVIDESQPYSLVRIIIIDNRLLCCRELSSKLVEWFVGCFDCSVNCCDRN